MEIKKILKITAALSTAITLTSCGGANSGGGSAGGDDDETIDAKEVYGCNVLNIYNWGEYIG